jgi:hypothetical protein
MLPGYPDSLIDLLPTDHAVSLLLSLFFGCFTASQTYHVCGGHHAIRLEEFLNVLREYISRTQRAAPNARIPDLVEPRVYQAFSRAANRLRHRSWLKLSRIANTMLPHLALRKIFEPAMLQSSSWRAPTVPEFREYFPRVLDFCVRTHWHSLITKSLLTSSLRKEASPS